MGLMFLGESCIRFPSTDRRSVADFVNLAEPGADLTVLVANVGLVLAEFGVLGFPICRVLLFPVGSALGARCTAGDCCLGVTGADLLNMSLETSLPTAKLGISCSSKSSTVVERLSSMLLPKLDVSKAANSAISCILSCNISLPQKGLAAACAVRDPSGIPSQGRGVQLQDLDLVSSKCVTPRTLLVLNSLKLLDWPVTSFANGSLALFGRKLSARL